jgi:hypothetical protein
VSTSTTNPEILRLVLDACRSLIAAGRVPTGVRLAQAVPRYSEITLVAYRRRLAAEGLIDWSHLVRDYRDHGLPCDTEDEREVIRRRAALVRARIDPDTLRPLPDLQPDRRTSTQ